MDYSSLGQYLAKTAEGELETTSNPSSWSNHFSGGIAFENTNPDLSPYLAAGLGLGRSAVGGAIPGAALGTLAGLGYGTAKGQPVKGAIRGLTRGGMTGVGAGLGAGLGGMAGAAMGGDAKSQALKTLLGSLTGVGVGGLGGYGLSGAVMGDGNYDEKKAYDEPEEKKEPGLGAFGAEQGAKIENLDRLIALAEHNRKHNPHSYFLNPFSQNVISEPINRAERNIRTTLGDAVNPKGIGIGRNLAIGGGGALLGGLAGTSIGALLGAVSGGNKISPSLGAGVGAAVGPAAQDIANATTPASSNSMLQGAAQGAGIGGFAGAGLGGAAGLAGSVFGQPTATGAKRHKLREGFDALNTKEKEPTNMDSNRSKVMGLGELAARYRDLPLDALQTI